MKKLVLAVSLFVAFAANAQQRRDIRNDKTEFRQNHNDPGGLRLTAVQQRKIDMLSRERLNPREYDASIRRILTKDQYARYNKSQQKDFKKDKKVAFNRSFR